MRALSEPVHARRVARAAGSRRPGVRAFEHPGDRHLDPPGRGGGLDPRWRGPRRARRSETAARPHPDPSVRALLGEAGLTARDLDRRGRRAGAGLVHRAPGRPDGGQDPGLRDGPAPGRPRQPRGDRPQRPGRRASGSRSSPTPSAGTSTRPTSPGRPRPVRSSASTPTRIEPRQLLTDRLVAGAFVLGPGLERLAARPAPVRTRRRRRASWPEGRPPAPPRPRGLGCGDPRRPLFLEPSTSAAARPRTSGTPGGDAGAREGRRRRRRGSAITSGRATTGRHPPPVVPRPMVTP